MSWPSILVGLFLYVPTRYGQTVTSAVVPPSSVAEDGNTNTWPAPAIETTGPGQFANALYQVDDSTSFVDRA